jgi:putative molybdopterin biosynthesis protein
MAVRTGEADVGLGIRVAAERCGLEFVPLETETFQLAIPATVLGHPSGSAFLEQLLESLRESSRRGAPGYSLRSLGRMRPAPIRTATERAAPPEPLS